ncbi:hypothetical protein [Cellulomonas rhizosphaerae]|uniref:hypothetical protein n=1 Tax=Cellulomonas rhizosphaerae TaxID=2293719 RepID=UPI0010FEBBF3|nr:hypothetical protein [Cellulomonas rhizosphaerae]
MHLVQSTLIVTAVDVADPALAAHRRDLIAKFASTYGLLDPDGAEVTGCEHRAVEICERCTSVVAS